MRPPLLVPTPSGLYCSAGDFYIDPTRPVPFAVLTHAHADHARPGSASYLAASEGRPLLEHRLGKAIRLRTVDYGETIAINGVTVSLHPAGHILGSAQIRLAWRGEVWGVSGDYKTMPDPTCAAFEPIRCHTFVTESTFGLPVFHWEDPVRLMEALHRWWRHNQQKNRTSLLYVYALGKAQRVLAALRPEECGSVLVHGAVAAMNRAYEASGIALCPTRPLAEVSDRRQLEKALVLAPPSAARPGWLRRLRNPSTGFASGWMQIRGFRRRRAVDRGFALSDHCDWKGLVEAVEATGAERLWTAHGYGDALARFFSEKGLEANAVETRPSRGGEEDQDPTLHGDSHGGRS
jgi:putative mRNA 3-end processing factor